MKLQIKVASTSQTVNVFIQNSSSTTGAGLAGLAFDSAGLTAYYALPRAAPVSITLATLAAVTSGFSSGGFKELDATNMPGWYRFDIPDAALASGRFVGIHLKGATNMAPLPLEIELTAWNNQDAVRGGMTALPNAAADAAGGLPISDAGGLDLDSKLANTNEVTAARMGALTDWINGGRLDLILDIIAADTTTDIPALIAALNNLSSAQAQTAAAAALTAYDPPTHAEMTAELATADDATLSAIAALNNLSSAQAQTAAAAALTAYDPPTHAELTAGLATADDAVLAEVALVKAKTDNLPSDPADASVISGRFDTLDTSVGDLPTNAELATALGTSDDAVLAAIAALNNLAAGAAMTLTSGERTAIATALLDLTDAIETGLTLRQAQRLQSAASAGKISGAATTTVAIRNAVQDSKDRITATVDADGNRTAVSVDVS